MKTNSRSGSISSKKNIDSPKPSALVLFSGGLDSRLAVKLLQEQEIDVTAVMFKLPFGGGCCNDELCSFRFSQLQDIKLKIIDCTKGKLYNEYLNLVKKPKHGHGTAINPCIDCRIFLLKQAKTIAKKLKTEIIATGEVLGERPMSQNSKSLKLIDKEIGFEVLRPLSAKLLPETSYEKKGLVDRTKLQAIQGRQRKIQMDLAKKYKITYPLPGGGCILCEKTFEKKLKDLFKHKPSPSFLEIESLKGGRHFRKNNKIVLGRNEKENNHFILINKKLKYNIIIPEEIPGPTAIFEDKTDKPFVQKLIKAYSEKDLKARIKFDKFRV